MSGKRLEGRDEPIIDPELPIIDSQFHLFERPGMRYLAREYREDAEAGHRIVSSVYVETRFRALSDGPELLRPLGEIEFAAEVAEAHANGPCRIAAGIVAFADLSAADAVATYLDQAVAAGRGRLRGVRQLLLDHVRPEAFALVPQRPTPGLIKSEAFQRGFSLLAARGLSFDAAVFHTQLADIARLAARFPDVTIILNHMGFAITLDLEPQAMAETFLKWREDLTRLSEHPNVVCKIGGLGMPAWGFGFEARESPVGYQELATAWRPYIETAIAAFGVKRCMMESNFPPDSRSCGFVPLWNALKHAVAGCSASEKSELFHGTAARVYRL